MGGALVQLIAYGSQDIILTTEPEITFFKAVFKRSTHFAIESIEQLVEGNINFGGNVTLVVARNGDLLGSIFMETSLPPNPQDFVSNLDTSGHCGYIQGVGNYLINNVSIEIGGSNIDTHYGKWMDIWSELSLQESQLKGYGYMVGKDYTQPAWKPYNIDSQPGGRVYVPLQFWFCRNPGLAIPLVALQYHELRLRIQFEKFENLLTCVNRNGVYYRPVVNGSPCIDKRNFKIWNTYYFLDTTERRKFSQNPHEYLITQVQSQVGNVSSIVGENNIRINLNHPTKEFIFVFNRNNSNAPMNDFSMGINTIPTGIDSAWAPVYNCKLIIQGTDRFKERRGEFFRLVQPYEHHTRIPVNNYIHVYSFSLRPEEHQPSGTCNFSRIDSAQLWFNLRSSDVAQGDLPTPTEPYGIIPSYTFYAPCYNVLRIMGGMGGLSYSN